MNESITRRDLLKYGVAAAASAALGDLSLRGQSAATQRTVILFFNFPERFTNGIADEFRSPASPSGSYLLQPGSRLIIQFYY